MQQFYETNYGSFTANGKKKSNNEDYYCNEVPEIAQDLLDLGSIFIVADGVGGAAHGELASKYAAELLRFEYYRKVNESIPERLRSGLRKQLAISIRMPKKADDSLKWLQLWWQPWL